MVCLGSDIITDWYGLSQKLGPVLALELVKAGPELVLVLELVQVLVQSQEQQEQA